MTLTKEDFKDIADGDWLHVEYLEGAQASGVVKRVEELHLKIDLGGGIGAGVFHTIGELTTVHVSRIIEHRPVKRAPKVGDVIERDEWDRYDWPEGWTWLHTYPALGGGAYGRSIDGETPCYFAGDVILNWPVTVVQLPTPASDPAPRVLTTVEELEALPVGSIIEDADDSALRRCKGGWGAAGRFWPSWTSSGIPLPVTVLREGGATS